MQTRGRYRVITVNIDPAALEEFREFAAAHGRSVNGEIRYALRVYANNVRRRQAATGRQDVLPRGNGAAL